MNQQKHKQAGNFYYCPNNILGTGSWGTVYKAKNVNDGTQKWYALKKINKFKIQSSESSLQKYKNEVLSLQRGQPIKQIIKFVDFFKSKSHYYIVTEYEQGSYDLYNYMKANPQKFTQLQARIVWYDLLKGIQQLHKLKITHRDLKLQNILYMPQKKSAKIIDFGLATNFDQVTGRVGSILFMPPQIIKNQTYTQKCDTWSLGIIFYWMVCKTSPYGQNSPTNRILQLMKQLNNCKKLPTPKGIYLSESCQEVIKGCLKWQQSERKSIEQLLKMQFFTSPNINQVDKYLKFYEPELTFVN